MTTYYTRRKEGLCVACGKRTQRTISGKARCAECEKRVKENERYRTALRKKNGLCLWCGKPSENRLCNDCREKERRYRANWLAKRSIDKKDSQ